MSGTNQSTVKVTLRNPLDHTDLLDYYIHAYDNPLAQDWICALKEVLLQNKQLEKNYCFLGFPDTPRTLEFLCDELNIAVATINKFDFTKQGLENYIIEEWFHPNTLRFPTDVYPVDMRNISEKIDEHGNWLKESDRKNMGLYPKHSILNQLHNHFEILQGTVDNLSEYYKCADHDTKYAIRQLNIICHEAESLILSQRKVKTNPEWIRPSQIMTFLHVTRYDLKDEHRQGFVNNKYDRRFGHVYMHWTQIGKTLFEVWRDEDTPNLDNTVCDAITHLQCYSGEFDVEWGKDVISDGSCPWHDDEQLKFKQWLINNNLDPNDPKLSLGYLPIGEIDLITSFGTTKQEIIWSKLSNYLDVYSIEVDGVKNTFDYCWTDSDHKQRQIDMMRPGYDFSSRR